MTRSALFVLCTALAVAGCGKTAATPPATPVPDVAAASPANSPYAPEAAPAPEAPKDEATADDAPARQIGGKIPDGWTGVPAEELPPGILGMIVQKSLKARILIDQMKPDGKTATEQVAEFCKGAPEHGVKVTAPVTSKDGRTAYTSIDAGANHGRFQVKHLADGTVIVFVGRWPAANDKAAAADMDQFVESTDYR